MRNKSTVEFLGLWERIHNQDFNYLEFEVIDKDAVRNGFVLTPKRWMEIINASLIRQGLPQKERLLQLNNTAITQMISLANLSLSRRLK